MSKFRGIKTNNAQNKAKEKLRRLALNEAECKNVLEVFSGYGEMYKKCYTKANNYLGIDKVKSFDERECIVGDALGALHQIDISLYDVIDVDAYGSPYSVLDCISRKQLHQGTISLVVTDGAQMDLRMGRVCKGLRDLAKIQTKTLRGANKLHDQIINRAMQEFATRTNKKIGSLLLANGLTGSGMKYYKVTLNPSD